MATVLITGSSTGLGLATAVALARAGHDVYATMRNPARSPQLQTIARKESLPISILRLDVDRDESVMQAVRQVLAERGHVDVLVNNAGILAFGAVEDLPLDVFRQAMETNYFGALRCIQAVLPSMRERRSGPFDLDVAIDSEPEAGAHPLIVVSHGTGGSNLGHHDTAIYLARHGFVVATPMHPGDNFQDTSAYATDAQLFGRPRHVKAVLDAVVAHPVFGRVVDTARIGIVGMSAGGYTALVLAGGRPDFSKLGAYCREQPADPWVCGRGRKSEAPPGVTDWALVRDSRIKSAVLLAPALGPAFESGWSGRRARTHQAVSARSRRSPASSVQRRARAVDVAARARVRRAARCWPLRLPGAVLAGARSAGTADLRRSTRRRPRDAPRAPQCRDRRLLPPDASVGRAASDRFARRTTAWG